MDQPKESGAAIGALADHFKVTTEDLRAWLRQENGIPLEVLLSWIVLWHQRRRREG